MILEQAIQEFDRHMAVERNLSDQTRRSYLSDLRQYRAFLERRDELRGRGRTVFPRIRW